MPASFADMPAAERRRRRFLNVALTTHEGKTVRFYDDLIKDKTVLLNFFYTNCVNEAVCPLTTANLVRVQKLLAPRVGRDVFIYSITLDPEHDTPNVLAKYARAFEIKPGWLFLTGKPEDIEALRRSLGYASPNPVEDKDRSQHIGMLRMGIEPLERWAACASLVRPEWIVQSLVRLEPRQAAQQERHGGKSRL
ncbi:MAG: SCO family protein [Candidatus Rokuibacteriota bacterium]|nr:MAG: SCO family protein [Candidatus Rokubacteria bacterium]